MKCKKILTALLAAACTMSGCHGDLDIMQDNKLSASNMWIDESDAETATYGIYLYMRDALKSVHDIYLCWGEFRNGLWGAGTNKTLSGVDQTQVRTSTMSSSNAYADWSVMYKTVNQANLILKHVRRWEFRNRSAISVWATPISPAHGAISGSHASGATLRWPLRGTNPRAATSTCPARRKQRFSPGSKAT